LTNNRSIIMIADPLAVPFLLNCDHQIVSVSFGATRDFHLREAAAGGGAARRRLCVRLSPGDVLVMRGALQRRWQHALPKRAGVDGPRVSLTFRRIVAPEAAR
jgi:hypothetical protein